MSVKHWSLRGLGWADAEPVIGHFPRVVWLRQPRNLGSGVRVSFNRVNMCVLKVLLVPLSK